MTNPTPARDRTKRRLQAIGWLTAGATATAALTAAGLWLITASPSTQPTTSPTKPAISAAPSMQNLPAPATTPTHRPSPSATPSAAPSTGHGDPMAGAIPDSLIQQTLDDAGLTTVNAATVKATRGIAWAALAADLQAGGWSHPHLQGASVTAPGNDQVHPTIVDVTAIWSATNPARQPVDRQRSTVRLTSTAGRWAVDRIT
jgi:hypothetical protein